MGEARAQGANYKGFIEVIEVKKGFIRDYIGEHRDYIPLIGFPGSLYTVYMGIMEKRMETTI